MSQIRENSWLSPIIPKTTNDTVDDSTNQLDKQLSITCFVVFPRYKQGPICMGASLFRETSGTQSLKILFCANPD